MNYYEHHIGDYAEATAHLTFIEDAAYSRLIRKYYATERPLPAELKAVQRLVGARTKEERDAVDAVLQEFFTLQEDGWHQSRCDQDVARYHEKQDKARASANARWTKPQSVGNATDMRTHIEGNANASKTHDGRNALQTPDTRHQSPDSKEIPDPTGLVASADAEAPPAQVVKLADRRIPCPAEKLLEAFHAECPTLPRVMKLNDRRRAHLTARWREVDADSKFTNSEDGIEVFRGIFRKVNASDFLAGRAKSWHATFDWLTDSSTNFLKVCEGHYDNDRRAAK